MTHSKEWSLVLNTCERMQLFEETWGNPEEHKKWLKYAKEFEFKDMTIWYNHKKFHIAKTVGECLITVYSCDYCIQVADWLCANKLLVYPNF